MANIDTIEKQFIKKFGFNQDDNHTYYVNNPEVKIIQSKLFLIFPSLYN
jgi:hypothetical protein